MSIWDDAERLSSEAVNEAGEYASESGVRDERYGTYVG